MKKIFFAACIYAYSTLAQAQRGMDAIDFGEEDMGGWSESFNDEQKLFIYGLVAWVAWVVFTLDQPWRRKVWPYLCAMMWVGGGVYGGSKGLASAIALTFLAAFPVYCVVMLVTGLREKSKGGPTRR